MVSRLIFKYFVQKRCKLKFRKSSVWKNGAWYDVKDASIMKYLKELSRLKMFNKKDVISVCGNIHNANYILKSYIDKGYITYTDGKKGISCGKYKITGFA